MGVRKPYLKLLCLDESCGTRSAPQTPCHFPSLTQCHWEKEIEVLFELLETEEDLGDAESLLARHVLWERAKTWVRG